MGSMYTKFVSLKVITSQLTTSYTAGNLVWPLTGRHFSKKYMKIIKYRGKQLHYFMALKKGKCLNISLYGIQGCFLGGVKPETL